MFRKMPLTLLLLLGGILLLNPYLSLLVKQLLYSISLSIKSGVLFLVPLMIFGLLFTSVVRLAGQASQLLVVTIALVCCSNLLSTLISGWIGTQLYPWIHQLPMIPQMMDGLVPLWSFHLPQWFSNDVALLSGALVGLIMARGYPILADLVAQRLTQILQAVLTAITLVVPLFIAGFIIKLQADGLLLTMVHQYGLTFAIIALAQYGYILFHYRLLSHQSRLPFWKSIQPMLPATLAGLCSMSSAASLPLTLMGVQRHAKNPALVQTVVSTTVNIHLVGDCFAIPILAYTLLKVFGLPEPSLFTYLLFTLYFVLAKFSVAAIPGGGIIVMLPLLEKHLGFTSEMLSLITTLYMLLDPLITSANVFGNGVFALWIDRWRPKTTSA